MPSDEGMGRGDEKRRKRLNRGRFTHEFSLIYSNWRLVYPVLPFKTGACLLMGRNFGIVARNITAYLYWKRNYVLASTVLPAVAKEQFQGQPQTNLPDLSANKN